MLAEMNVLEITAKVSKQTLEMNTATVAVNFSKIAGMEMMTLKPVNTAEKRSVFVQKIVNHGKNE